MRAWLRYGSLALLIAVPRLATAQDPTGSLEEEEAPPPPPDEPPPRPAPPPPRAAAPADARDRADLRPGKSVGIGAGFAFPTDITMPSVVSVRFRLASGMTFEPMATIQFNNSATSTDLGPTENEDTASGFTFGVGTNLRVPFASHGRVDFIGIGAASLTFASTNTDPDGPDNAINTSNIAFGIGYGLGLEYFIKPHWSLSFDATNPILTLSKVGREDDATEMSTTTLTVGAVWNPAVRLMFHLYY